MEISRLGPDDVHRLVAASALFDQPSRYEWAALFLRREGHHLLMASVEGVDVGFVSGVEITHPDKGTEMLVYELGVHEQHRRRGIGRALVDGLRALAIERGCYGMWVGTDRDNAAALATYRGSGAAAPEPCVILTWTFDRGPDVRPD